MTDDDSDSEIQIKQNGKKVSKEREALIRSILTPYQPLIRQIFIDQIVTGVELTEDEITKLIKEFDAKKSCR